MTQISLLDPARLSQLLQDALSWKDSTSSLMVSAANGSILAYAFKQQTPGIKDLRTMSTTMTAAYTIASEDILVFEAQVTRALSVIVPIGDHVLLAVNGPARPPLPEPETTTEQSSLIGDQPPLQHDDGNPYEPRPQTNGGSEEQNEVDEVEQEQVRLELEEVAESLAGVLREELAGLKWPGDI